MGLPREGKMVEKSEFPSSENDSRRGYCYSGQPIIGELEMPYKDKEVKRAYQREWCQVRYRRRKLQGLCVFCGKPVGTGYWICPMCVRKRILLHRSYHFSHRGEMLRKQRAYRAKLVKEGRCYDCGAPLLEDEIKYCFGCHARRNN